MSLGLALAVVAIVVSVLAAWTSLHAQREVIRAETVTAIFDGFRRVSELRIGAWEAAHVLETPENYERTAALLRTALAGTPPEGAAELRIRERAVAVALIQIFEESVYHYEHARRLRDPGRQEFLRDVLDYYTERLLLNPRLLHLWSPVGENVREDFEPPTRAYYDQHVRVPDRSEWDAVGPIPEVVPGPSTAAGPSAAPGSR